MAAPSRGEVFVSPCEEQTVSGRSALRGGEGLFLLPVLTIKGSFVTKERLPPLQSHRGLSV
jgi:hypothetical protein